MHTKSITKIFSLHLIFCTLSKLLVLWTIVFFSCFIFSSRLFANSDSFNAKYFKNNDANIDRIISKMPLEKKVGQLFIYGFIGKRLNFKLKKLLSRHTPGGVIIFKRNIHNLESIYQLNLKMQQIAKQNSRLPLFIMVDQEGGNVSRLKIKPRPPSAHAIGQTKNLLIAKRYGQITGELLYLTGFNFNLAPVTDLSNPYVKNFIGSRSFGDHPEDVYLNAREFSKGLLEYSVLPTFKHYPGHGNINQDSHHKTPIKNSTLRELSLTDLVPYSNLANSKMPSAVMTSHIVFPNIDSSLKAATYSRVLLTDILRKKLGYTGLIITDDLQMTGASGLGHVGRQAVAALNAGCDMLMVAWSLEKQVFAQKFVLSSVKRGLISENRINDSLRRILRIKLNQDRSPAFDPKVLQSRLSKLKREMNTLSKQISKLNLKNKSKPKKRSVLLDRHKNIQVFSADSNFFSHLKKSIGNPMHFHKLSRANKNSVEKNFTKK